MHKIPWPARFWAKVTKTDKCWEWTGGHRTNSKWSYGVAVMPDRKKVLAHRVSWTLTNGPIPEGMSVLHRCDNPPCVRPDHLFLGTHVDNMQDLKAKGRHPNNGKALLRGYCRKRGHLWSTVKLYFDKYGSPHCSECLRIDGLARWRAKRDARLQRERDGNG